ncbi:helicase associated domain-containing protein [Mycena epipterygia]|nr:helicase associated domain-containing protein [Mycena epipterygia]
MRALELLNYLGAIDDEGNLTTLGAMMAEFPLEPQLAKMLIVSPIFKCSGEILTIVAMLSVPHVWIRPIGQWKEADAAKTLLNIPGSDHLTLLNVYNQWKNNIHDKNWAYSHFLSLHVLSEAEKARKQLERIMEGFKLELVSSMSGQRRLHKRVRQVLVCGFFMQVAHREGRNYVTIKDKQAVQLHPSSGLVTKPEWVIFNEFVVTSRPYIRTITEVPPEWLLHYAHNYFDLNSFLDGAAKRALQRVAAQLRRTHKDIDDVLDGMRLLNL